MRAMQAVHKDGTYDVLILGAGYAGLMAALRLSRRKLRLRVGLVSAQDPFLERVRLQESIVAPVTSRIPSISAFLAGTAIDFFCGRVAALDANGRRVHVATGAGERVISFVELIYALGSNINVDDVPGAAEHAFQLDAADGARSAAALRSTLQNCADRTTRVLVVGGSETAIEVAGEVKTAWPRAEVVMVSRARCGSFRGVRVGRVVRAELRRLGVKLVDDETITEVHSNKVVTDRFRSIAYDICVWSGGLRAAPIARLAGLATDAQDRILVNPGLQSISHSHVLAAGDAVHPIAPTGAPFRLSAFAALVSGAHAADSIVARRADRALQPFSFSTFGQGVALGRGGVGFFSYPDDRQVFFILEGRTARHVRDFFVWFTTFILKVERKFPGFFFWPGRRRVSWHEADSAIREAQAT